LLSPSERFAAPPPEPEPAPLQPVEAGAPPASPQRTPSRHERRRFQRAGRANRSRYGGAARRTIQSSSASKGEENSGNAPADTPPLPPALLRARESRRRFWLRFAGALGVLSLAGAIAAALYAPMFNVEAVSVSGLSATPDSLVRPIAARLIGHNVFRAPKKAIVRALETLPTVAWAGVRLHAGLPPRLELVVHERQPILRVNDGTGEWVADTNGVPYRLADARDAHLPVVHWKVPLSLMKHFDAQTWNDAVRLAGAVQNAPQNASGSGWKLRAMNLDQSGDATLTLATRPNAPDVTVRLGNDEWREKVARMRVALEFFARTKRDPQELNLISLHLPRWTARPVAVAPDGSAIRPPGGSSEPRSG